MVFIGKSRNMKLSCWGALLADSHNKRLCFCNLLPAAAFLAILFFIGSSLVTFDYKEKISTWKPTQSVQITKHNLCESLGKPLGSEPLPKGIVSSTSNFEMQPLSGSLHSPKQRKKISTWKPTQSVPITKQNLCESQGKPLGSEPLPKGIVSSTSNFEMQPLWGSLHSPKQRKGHKISSKSLLAIAVGMKQKEVVDEIVKKFSSSDFIVMLFHYDGVVDKWRDLSWSDKALHISAINQTKWWFAKRFLHPDIVAEYDYIFLWDEDIDVEHFDPQRYLSIVRREGLEISQPGLDTSKSQVHHQITARSRRGDVHRRVYKFSGGARCYENSTGPPCTGWVEMMVPVFSRSAWRCAWLMIQNDLIHAWGLDFKLGYCAQGDRSKKVGVVDTEYIGHIGLPTLGGFYESKSSTETSSDSSQSKASASPPVVSSGSPTYTDRHKVRYRSYAELDIFRKRWQQAVMQDKCWVDPYPESIKKESR